MGRAKREFVVYGLVDPRSGALRYVGKTAALADRLAGHRKALGRSHKANWIRKLQQYGLNPEAVILESFESESAALSAESEWISMARSWGCDLTNHSDGGEGGYAGVLMCQETKDKIRKALLGHKHSAETKAKIGAANAIAHLNKPKSKQHAANISKARKGMRFTDEHCKNIGLSKLKKAGV